jgi:hypothetical protein
LPVDRSLKFTICGEQPDVGDAEKFAVTWLLLLKLNEISKMNSKKYCLGIVRVNVGIQIPVFCNYG